MYNNNDSNSRAIVQVDADLEVLIPGFLCNKQKDIEAIREALSRGDFEAIRIVGHSMKGSGSGYGFPYITELGYSIESHSLNQAAHEIRELTDQLERYLNNIEIEYIEM
jgi:HPt (histidine-containing phosphotransfer) domain-containing protein